MLVGGAADWTCLTDMHHKIWQTKGVTVLEKYKMRARQFAILTLCWLFYFPTMAFPPRAYSFEQKNLPFESEPTGALVCERRKGVIACFDRTPCRVTVEFASASNAREYILKKIGYKTAKITVTRADETIHIAMKREELFEETAKESVEELLDVRRQVVKVLSRRIHEDLALFDDSGFDLLGRIGVLLQPDGYYVGLGVILDDRFRQSSLRQLERIRNTRERQEALVRTVLEYAGGRVLVELGKTLRSIKKLKGIILNVHYMKNRSVLEDDIDTFRVHKTWHWEQGGYRYEKHFWYTQEVSGTNVKDIEDMYTVAVKADIKDIPLNEAQCCTSIVTAGEIYTNDNRNRKMERLSK